MGGEPVKVMTCSSEEESWDTIWKWGWFARSCWKAEYWEEASTVMKPLLQLLSQFCVGSVLDCSCGLGFKTVLLAKAAYEVEGSDGSPVAIEHAPQLAKEEGLSIRFFQSRYEKLGERSRRKYDCVLSDNFDEIETLQNMRASAQGIWSALNDGGRLVFWGPFPEWTPSDLREAVEREWRRRKRFDVSPACERGSVKVISPEVDDKTPEGVLENRIFLVEEEGVLRVGIAFMMNRVKWTFSDFREVMKGTGFESVVGHRVGETTFIVGTK